MILSDVKMQARLYVFRTQIRLAGPIATSAFNRLSQYASSPGTEPLLRRTRSFFPSGDLDHHQ